MSVHSISTPDRTGNFHYYGDVHYNGPTTIHLMIRYGVKWQYYIESYNCNRSAFMAWRQSCNHILQQWRYHILLIRRNHQMIFVQPLSCLWLLFQWWNYCIISVKCTSANMALDWRIQDERAEDPLVKMASWRASNLGEASQVSSHKIYM